MWWVMTCFTHAINSPSCTEMRSHVSICTQAVARKLIWDCQSALIARAHVQPTASIVIFQATMETQLLTCALWMRMVAILIAMRKLPILCNAHVVLIIIYGNSHSHRFAAVLLYYSHLRLQLCWFWWRAIRRRKKTFACLLMASA